MNLLNEVADKNSFEASSVAFKKTITLDEGGRLLFGRVCPTKHTGNPAFTANLSPKEGFFSRKRRKLTRSHNLAKDLFLVKRRDSGKPYLSHPENVAGYYNFFSPKPTDDGIIQALHHDSPEEFPQSISRISGIIGDTNTQAVALLSKFKPDLIQEAQRYPQYFGPGLEVHRKISLIISQGGGLLYGLDAQRGLMQLAFTSQIFFYPLMKNMPKTWQPFYNFLQGNVLNVANLDQQEVLIIGELFHAIVASGEREDVVNEIALMTNLLQMQNHDTLYVKLCDRLDNLTSVEHLEKLCNSGLDREKIEKKIRARRKILATSQVYLYIALKKLQDPRLYGALEYMIEWNEQKLETFEKTIERREKEGVFTEALHSPASSPSS